MKPLVFSLIMALILSTPGPSRAASEPEEPQISDIVIQLRNTGEEDDLQRLERMAQAAIFLSPGDRFSPERLQASIDALQLIELFKAIHVDSKDEDDRIVLIFDLTVVDRIKEINIDGNFPVFEQEVLNAMNIAVGDAFFEDKIAEQKERLVELFKRQGFFDPTVRLDFHRDPEDGHYRLRIDIDKGPHYDIKEIRIKGNDAFGDFRLKLRMDAWSRSFMPGSSGRYVEKDFKEDVENLRDYYRSKGYAQVEIDYDPNTDKESRSARPTVTISEGPRYKVGFQGNEEFWGFTLKKDLTLFDEGDRGGVGLRKSVRQIEQRYEAAGYSDVSVEVQEEKEEAAGEGARKLDIDIREGPRAIVESVAISGNEAFDDEKIKKQMLIRPPGFLHSGAFNPGELKEDENAILALYYKEGYLSTQVDSQVDWSEDKTRVSVAVNIAEGVRTRVSSVAFEGNTLISDEQALEVVDLKPGEPFRQYMVESDRNQLAALISEKGYPYIRIEGDVSFSDDDAEARITYQVDEGIYVEMGEIHITGNFRTRERTIRRELEIQPGDPFSPEKLLETQRNIRNLDVFDSVQFKAIGLKEKADTVDLFVEVAERRPYAVTFGGGYDTRRNLFGHVRAEDRNLLGLNLTTWVAGEVSQIGYRAEYGFREPRLLGSRIAMSLGLFAEERDEFNQEFGVRTYGASAAFNREFFEKLNLSLGLRFENRDQFRHDDAETRAEISDAYDEDEFRPRRILVASPAVTLDTRDSFINPKKGLFSSLSADISTGLENSVDNFVKYRLDARWYVSPFKRLTFALRGLGGYIDPYGDVEKVPDDQLFFLGGTSDIRGFDENLLLRDASGDPLGGHKMAMGSVEARIDLGKNFQLALFYDIGRLSDTFGGAGDAAGWRSTTGAGIRYITPVGPIGFLYGFKIDPREEEAAGRLHFSIGYTF